MANRLPGSWSLIPFAIDYVVGMLLAGRTLGMYLFGAAGRPGRPRRRRSSPGGPSCAPCCSLLLIPALICDRDGRGLHDRVTDTAVVRL